MSTTGGLSDAKGDLTPQEAPPFSEARAESAKPTVLMADADRLTAWALGHFLRASHRVVHVATAAEAREQLQRGPAHALVVSDNLPQREVEGLIATALERHAGLTIIKLVSLVDEEPKDVPQRVIMVEKPFDLAHMKSLLEQPRPTSPAPGADRLFRDGAS
jgi:DNA-binding NtrC family response regulator